MPRRKLTKAERRVNFNAKILPVLRTKYARICVKEKVSQAKKLEIFIEQHP